MVTWSMGRHSCTHTVFLLAVGSAESALLPLLAAEGSGDQEGMKLSSCESEDALRVALKLELPVAGRSAGALTWQWATQQSCDHKLSCCEEISGSLAIG